MLRDIVRFDLIVNRKALLLNAAIFTIFLTFLAHDAAMPMRTYTILGALLFSFGGMTVLTREDKFRSAALLLSLPVRRRDVVRGRYLLSASGCLLGAALALGLSLLPSARVEAGGAGPLSLLSPALVATSLAISVLLPFTIRFGMMGILVFLVGSQVLGLITLALFSLAKGTIEIELRQVLGRPLAAIRDLHQQSGALAFGLGTALVLLLLLGASYRISVALLERKEL